MLARPDANGWRQVAVGVRSGASTAIACSQGISQLTHGRIPLPRIQVPPLDQRPHLAVGHGALHHPEAAVRVYPANTVRAEDADGVLDPAGDLVRGFRLVVLDVDDTQAQGDRRLQVAEGV